MAGLNSELSKWYEEFQKLPPDSHLLCTQVDDDDNEDYKSLDDPNSQITREEKLKRIEEGERRLEITYWNSLVFGFEKAEAGQWLIEFTGRLESCLKSCHACALNWHMKRKAHLAKFSERWNEDAVAQIEELLDRLDVRRISENLTWAKEFIEKIESTGTVFKKSQFGEKAPEVYIAVYEALCCVPFLANAEQRALFQYVFMRLQGKTYLKLGTKQPLPGMTYFLFDQKNEDRRGWAVENWKGVDTSSVTEEQFDWAISGGLISAMDDIYRRDSKPPLSETKEDTAQFWLAVEEIIRALPSSVIFSRLRSLEVKLQCPGFYDLLFRHISMGGEAVLMVCIRIISSLLKKSPKALWDFFGETRPTVIADILFTSPTYKLLLRQALDCLADAEPTLQLVPLPTSWIDPLLRSLSWDRRYDACDGLLQTLFKFATDPSIGEPGQAACVRAGFDAIRLTISSFSEAETKLSAGTAHHLSTSTFNLVMTHSDLIISNAKPSSSPGEGWRTFKVAEAAEDLMFAAMRLDVRLFSEEYLAYTEGKKLQSDETRNSKGFWDLVVSMLDQSSDQVSMSRDILLSLAPLVTVEQLRPRKVKDLEKPEANYNSALGGTEDVLARLLGRVSELDATDLNSLFSNRVAFQVIIGLSLHGETDLAEAASEVLKSWTGELSRSAALEQMTRLHTDQTLASAVWCLERILNAPYPWGPIRPLLHMSRDILRGLADPSDGVLRLRTLDSKSASTLLRWWVEQWHFVSVACQRIEVWNLYIHNSIMTEFCRDIMELAEAVIAEDGLFVSATALGRSEKDMMVKILAPAKNHFRGMENMIRLKDRWLVDVTVRVLCKILKRLRENNLEIMADSRKLITDACIPNEMGKYPRATNLTDQERAELLQALGQTEDEIEIIQISKATSASDKSKKQSRLDAWSKSGPPGSMGPAPRSNKDDVLEMSKSANDPRLKQIEARQAKAKAKTKAQSLASLQNNRISAESIKESRQREKAEKAKRDAEAIAHAKQLRGEDTGFQGVLGKDHSRSEIMVNSSDEEDSDAGSTDDDNELATLATGGQSSRTEAEKRREKALRDKERQPVKKQRQQRSAKDMRARITPNMSKLHNTILAWDIFHDGNEPPGGPKATSVATKYGDPSSYQQTFFPLLVSEAWRSFVTAKDELTAQSFGMKIASRASVDSFLEVTFTMPVVQNRERGVSEGDILLVSEDQKPLSHPEARHCLARVHKITYKRELIEITYRVSSRNNPLASALTPGQSVRGIKITNMTPIEREYAALERLQFYDLMDEILKAKPSPILRYGEEKVKIWMQNWSLNRGQAQAVLGAQDNDGFTLIQGPPGTGKTKTIIAMVGALLSEQLAKQSGGTPMGAPVQNPAAAATQPRPKKLLVCAPSNAAVDELVLRLKAGVRTVGGKTRKIDVLRLGRSDAINAAVKDVTLDELVKARLEGDKTRENAQADRDRLHESAANIKEEVSQLRPRLEQARGEEDQSLYNKLARQFDDLKKKQLNISRQIDSNRESGNSIAREMDVQRKKVQQQILNSAHVLCATLSGSGHEMFKSLDVEFETVIIDEAAQCVELSALIPLKYGCCKCILVGDPKQLPPTVLSQSAARFGYDQSLFVRMQQNHPQSIHLLDMQYRMHPEISMFPSREFYEGQLQDGQDMGKLRQQPWHNSALLGPYRFFDVQGVQARGHRGQSLVNYQELEVALQMYDRFSKDYRECDLKGKIGIITPYKAQLFELRNRFKSRYGESITENIEFNTTDAFQGRECEIIIFSCVRASSTGGIGFMTDIRRMNVGLTRAKSSLWILGDSRALVQGEFWKKLIEDSQKRDRYTQGDVLSMFRRPLERSKNPTYVPLPAPQQTQDVDVDMVDAFDQPAPPKNEMTLNPKSNVSMGGVQRQSSSASNGMPVIQTSDGNDNKKRRLSSLDSGQPATKKIANDRPKSGLAGKFGQKPPPTGPRLSMPVPKPPTDPSAMDILGLTPPERPPARTMTMDQTTKNPSNSSMSSDQAGSAAPKKGPPPVMHRKKAKPNLFIKQRKPQ